MGKTNRGLGSVFALAIGVMAGMSVLMAGDERAFAQTQESAAVQTSTALAEGQPKPVERRIALKHHWTREQVDVVYRVGDVYQPEAMAAINRLMRDYRCQKQTQMDPKLIDLLYDLSQELGVSGPIRVVSAYRSEGYNASLLRAGRTVDPDSQHTLGHAADVIFPGVKPDALRAAAEAKGVGGVGYYPFSGPVFVHVDTGPVRHWVERDPGERRVMAAPRRRARLVLDCELTTDQALAEVSATQAYAALPDGASTKPHPVGDLLQIAMTGLPAFVPLMPGADAEGGDIIEKEGPVCQSNDPLAPLSTLATASVKRVSTGVHTRNLQRAKVKAQIKSERRSAKKARRASPRKLILSHRQKRKK